MTSPDPITPQTPPPPRRLTRSSSDQMLGGVGGGLGRYFDIDPILFRIGFVVAALAGGAGLLAYFALWVLVPDENGQTVKWPGTRNVALIVGGTIAVLVVIGLLPGPGLFIWPGFIGLVALGLLVVVVAGGDRGLGARSRLARGLMIAGAVVLAAVAGVSAAVGTAFGGGAVVAAIVIAIGCGLVAGAFGNGRRWLIIPALVLAAPAAIVEAADLRVTGGVGERQYRPTDVTELRDVYRLGAGHLKIDLSDIEFPSGPTDVAVDMGMGYVEVIVPPGVCVSSSADIGAGAASVFGYENDGVDVDWTQTPRNQGGSPELKIELEQDLGAFEVRHTGEDSAFEEDFDHQRDDAGIVAQEACA